MSLTGGLGPRFGRLWVAGTTSALGAGVYGAALPLLAVSLTTNPTLIASAAVAAELPWLIFGLLAGAVVDRLDSRRLIVVVSLINATLVAALAALIASHRANLPIALAIAFICGTCGTLVSTATTTMTPVLVRQEDLDRANGRFVTTGSAAAELVGPPLGGYLFGLAAALPFIVNTSLAALSASVIFTLPAIFRASTMNSTRPSSPPRLLSEITGGAKWLLANPRLRSLTLLSVVFALTDSAWFTLMVLYVRDVLDLPAHAYGLLLGIGALGGLIGGVTAATLSRAVGSTGLLLAILLVAAASAQAVLGLTAHAILTAGLLGVSSFAFGIWNVITTTLRQKITPPHLLGRVTSADRTAILSASPLGSLLGGIAASTLGIRAPFLLGAPLLLLAAAYGYITLRHTTIQTSNSGTA